MNNEASVEEEIDASVSEPLTSQSSHLENDTIDHSVSHSSIGADYVQKI